MTEKRAKRIVLPQNVHWFGGSACSGKTTFATVIERRYGFMIYHRDDHLVEHLEKATSDQHPMMYSVLSAKVRNYQAAEV